MSDSEMDANVSPSPSIVLRVSATFYNIKCTCIEFCSNKVEDTMITPIRNKA
jgi:hypothetical protein